MTEVYDRFVFTKDAWLEPPSAKSLTLTNFKLKAGYKEDQTRSSETGQWTGGGSTKPKKPKHPRKPRRTLEDEIEYRAATEGQFPVADEIQEQVKRWEEVGRDFKSEVELVMGEVLHSDGLNREILYEDWLTYNEHIYEQQRDFYLDLPNFHLHTVGSYTGDGYMQINSAMEDPLFWEWQEADEVRSDEIYGGLDEVGATSFTQAQQLRWMVEKSPELKDTGTYLYNGTSPEHFLNLKSKDMVDEFGKMLGEEYEKIGVNPEEAMLRMGNWKSEIVNSGWRDPVTNEQVSLLRYRHQHQVAIEQATQLMGNRLAEDINKNMKWRGEISPKRFLSMSTNVKVSRKFSRQYITGQWTRTGGAKYLQSSEEVVPRVIARYKGIKKGLGLSPITATGKFRNEYEVLVGGGTQKLKFVGASYVEEDYPTDKHGTINRGTVYVDFEGVE